PSLSRSLNQRSPGFYKCLRAGEMPCSARSRKWARCALYVELDGSTMCGNPWVRAEAGEAAARAAIRAAARAVERRRGKMIRLEIGQVGLELDPRRGPLAPYPVPALLRRER